MSYFYIRKFIKDRYYYATAHLGHMTSSADVNDAIQFHREQDAQLVANELLGPDYEVVKVLS